MHPVWHYFDNNNDKLHKKWKSIRKNPKFTRWAGFGSRTNQLNHKKENNIVIGKP